ncbi:TetR/AcrR family transcriptional regulator [Pseudomonas sp. BF-R-01]|jgi:AcrR family transcriptional regulator|uniref:TetR/AcrR family transcriptional regulator n=1 Tax=Pseudomonas sp. BF-R-01 TaxID=2832365 RepID=UPI001CBAB6AF|nr:TetR/AcrR family transcriptional regulator [Pseudomonas sp. BF-R-01]
MIESTHASHLRGPSEHSVRNQIVEAATAHFGRYGYEKTTVSNLAKSIGFSKAYIYKFFDSKLAIGEVICANRLATVMETVDAMVSDALTASEKLRALFRGLAGASSDLFFHDRKLYDIAAVAARDQWPLVKRYEERLREVVTQIILVGREAGEFERKTPLDEVVHTIYLVMRSSINPVQMQYNLKMVGEASMHLCALILRSLSP